MPVSSAGRDRRPLSYIRSRILTLRVLLSGNQSPYAPVGELTVVMATDRVFGLCLPEAIIDQEIRSDMGCSWKETQVCPQLQKCTIIRCL